MMPFLFVILFPRHFSYEWKYEIFNSKINILLLRRCKWAKIYRKKLWGMLRQKLFIIITTRTCSILYLLIFFMTKIWNFLTIKILAVKNFLLTDFLKRLRHRCFLHEKQMIQNDNKSSLSNHYHTTKEIRETFW